MTDQRDAPRPKMRDNMTFEQGPTDGPGRMVTWITDVDEDRMWKDFFYLVDGYQRTITLPKSVRRNRLTFMMP